MEFFSIPPPKLTIFPTEHLFTNQESDRMLDFMISNQNAASFVQRSEKKWKELREHLNTKESAQEVKRFFHEIIAPKLHKMDRFDLESKLKIMIYSSSRVAPEFLNELEKNAEIFDVDSSGVIYRYKRGDLEVPKNPRRQIFPPEEEDRILNFIAMKANTPELVGGSKKVFEDYIELERSERTVRELGKYWNRQLVPLLLRNPRFDMDTKIKMMFTTGSHPNFSFLAEMRKGADVLRLNDGGAIMEYKRGDLQLKSSFKIDAPAISAELEELMLQFVAREARKPRAEGGSEKVWREFKMEHKEVESSVSELKCFWTQKMSPILHKMHRFEQETVIRMLVYTCAPLSNEFEARLRESADFLELSDRGAIRRYEKDELRLEQSSSHRRILAWESLKSSDAPRKRALEEDGATGATGAGAKKMLIEPIVKIEQTYEIPVITIEDPLPELRPIKLEHEDVTTPSESLVDVKEFLKLLHVMILFLNSPQLAVIREKIDKSINSIAYNARKISIDKMRAALETMFTMAHSSAGNRQETVDLKNILQLLRGLAVSCDAWNLRGFVKEVEVAIQKLEGKEEKIPINNIRLAFEAAFIIIQSE